MLFVIDFGKVYFDLFFNGLLINFLIFFVSTEVSILSSVFICSLCDEKFLDSFFLIYNFLL